MKRVSRYLLLGPAAVVAVLPIVWTGYTAFKSRAEVSRSIWALPRVLALTNFRKVLANEAFGTYFLNSLIVSLLAVGVTLAAAALAGYAFARCRFRGRGAVFHLLLAGMMIPVHITLIPLVKTFGLVGIYDTRTGLVLVYVAFCLPASVFILRGFFASLPTELAEAAALDGCSPTGTFFWVMLPLSRPALAAVGAYNLVLVWNEFVFAFTLTKSPGIWTLPVGLMDFSHSHGIDLPLTCAALTITLAPILVLYLVAQRQILSGVTAGMR